MWAPVWCIIRRVRRKSVLKVGHILTHFPLNINWCTLKTEQIWNKSKIKFKQISNESQTMVKSFSRTSFPLNISWWQLKSHLFYTSSRISYMCVSKEQFPIWNVKNYWNWTEHLAKSHCCWWCQPQPTQCQLTRTINFSTSTPCQCTFCNSQIQLKILGIFSKPLLLYNCKGIQGNVNYSQPP